MNGSCIDQRRDWHRGAAEELPAQTELRRAGDAVELLLDGEVAKLTVGSGQAQAQIEISPAGAAEGEYFVATFVGARFGALVRLNETYDRVQEIDFKLMVGVDRDVTAFPSISLAGAPGARQVRIAWRGLPTRAEVVACASDAS